MSMRVRRPRGTLRMWPSSVAVALVAASVLAAGSAGAGATPGTLPASARSIVPRDAGTGGLGLIVNERGFISRSIAGVTDDGGGGTLTINKPAGAVVRGAYFFTATTGNTFTPLTAPVSIDGNDVPIDHEIFSQIGAYNYWAEVTSFVKSKIDAAPAGPVSFTVVEPDDVYYVDGEVMVVIYNDPAQTEERSVSILFGALNPLGDQYQIALAAPISLADPSTHLEMSLGISYSYQEFGTQQYSLVDVNGIPLTTAAGGEDDGASHNGALLTVGGEGDSLSNPVDPFATPTEPRSDDELYDLRPFVLDGDTRIDVQTLNPSDDDNIFMATFTMNPPVTTISTGPPRAYVAVGDSTTTGFSVPTCEEDRDASPYGCIGDPPAIPYPERIASERAEFSDLDRKGIWGYTIHDAVIAADQGHNDEGPWEPQLLATAHATELVTVSLGANDMQFSDVGFWLKECLAKQFVSLEEPCSKAARNKAEEARPDIQAMMDRLDAAAANGARVVIALYYNPYNDQKDAGPFGLFSRDCSIMWSISEIIVGYLNEALAEEAASHGFTLVDLRPAFRSHGAGSDDSYVFGSDCDIVGAATAVDVDFDLGWPPVSVNKKNTEAEIKKRFDPHPNDKGTTAQADEILKVLP
jgi:lysophospholipase L1-like esterase